MTVKRYTMEELDALNIKTCQKIVSEIKKALKDLMSHKDSEVTFIYVPAGINTAEIILSYPDLMDSAQRLADLSDAISIARAFDRVKKIKNTHEALPTFTDLYNGVMPSVSFDIELM